MGKILGDFLSALKRFSDLEAWLEKNGLQEIHKYAVLVIPLCDFFSKSYFIEQLFPGEASNQGNSQSFSSFITFYFRVEEKATFFFFIC